MDEDWPVCEGFWEITSKSYFSKDISIFWKLVKRGAGALIATVKPQYVFPVAACLGVDYER